MIRTYHVVAPLDRLSADYKRTTPSGAVITGAIQPDGSEIWTFDYSDCRY